MPGTLNAWCFGTSAMKLFAFLLLACVSLTALVDAQGSLSPNFAQEDDTNRIPTESPLFSTEEPGSESMTASSVFFREDSLTSEVPSVTEAETTEDITVSIGSSISATGLPSAKRPSVDKKKITEVQKIDHHQDIFKYDYYSLRKWGLIAAAILFILGILVLTCGKHGKSRCRGKKKSRNYDVTQA